MAAKSYKERNGANRQSTASEIKVTELGAVRIGTSNPPFFFYAKQAPHAEWGTVSGFLFGYLFDKFPADNLARLVTQYYPLQDRVVSVGLFCVCAGIAVHGGSGTLGSIHDTQCVSHLDHAFF